MKDTHREDISKDKGPNWKSRPTGRTEDTGSGESPLESTNFSKERDSHGFPLSCLPEGVDQEVFQQLPVDIQAEILTGQSREKIQLKGSLSPQHVSRGILSFFPVKKLQDSPLNRRDSLSSNKQILSVSPCEPGTSDSANSNSSYLSNQRDYSFYLDSQLKDEKMSQVSPGFYASNTNTAVTAFHSTLNLQSEQLSSPNCTTDHHTQPRATVSHQEVPTENRKQEPTKEKITFPSDIDPDVFYELPEEVQKELLAEWKRTGSGLQSVHK